VVGGRRAAWVLIAALATISAGAVGTAAAQDGQNVERRLPPRTEDDAPERAPRTPQAPSAETARGGPQAFVLTGVTIRGASVLDPDDFAPLYEPYLARTVSLADVAAIAEAVTGAYREAGYFLSRAVAPPQDVIGGMLEIRVVEGYLGDVTVEGADRKDVLGRLQRLTDERPLRLSTLERALALIGDLNGVYVRDSRIEPDLNDMAAHRLVVSVSVDHLRGSIYVDNRGTDAVGRIQAYAQAQAQSVLRTGDQLSVGALTIPGETEELVFAEASYEAPVGRTHASGRRRRGWSLCSSGRPSSRRRATRSSRWSWTKWPSPARVGTWSGTASPIAYAAPGATPVLGSERRGRDPST